MPRIIRRSGLLMCGVIVALQFVRPAAIREPGPRPDPIVQLGAQGEAATILRSACLDCHSAATRWPWYSQVSPVSLYVRDHVAHGRSHLDFSRWAELPPADRKEKLGAVCDLARNGVMPLRSYRLLHREARLSAAQIDSLCQWTASASQENRFDGKVTDEAQGVTMNRPSHGYPPHQAPETQPPVFQGAERGPAAARRATPP